MKRYFLQLAHVLNFKKHSIAGALMSEKLDGSRCFWDGAISRGLPIDQVPYANLNKKGHLTTQPISTGLWSRYGNVIRAPEWFLNQLPPYLIDGELYAGRRLFQFARSVTADHVPGPGWREIKLMVLDSPRPEMVFKDGEIDEVNFKRELVGCIGWAKARSESLFDAIPTGRYASFGMLHSWLKDNIATTANLAVHSQEQLPFHTAAARDRIEAVMTDVVDNGGEGVIIRADNSLWTPERSHKIVKYKPYSDAEGVVTGYVSGRETALGSKLLGLMGALILDFNGKRLELSGFTDAERVMDTHGMGGTPAGRFEAQEWGESNPGEEFPSDYYNPKFRVGSVVTFKYRELSDDKIPKEARYDRLRATSMGAMQ